MNAIEVRDVHKVYRRYGRRKQFATLKSALLTGSVLRDLHPDAVFEALKKELLAGKRVLNCFAYTCSFSVAAAKAGAITTSVR